MLLNVESSTSLRFEKKNQIEYKKNDKFFLYEPRGSKCSIFSIDLFSRNFWMELKSIRLLDKTEIFVYTGKMSCK